jgi:DNA-binding PadR family transcriptional regulator
MRESGSATMLLVLATLDHCPLHGHEILIRHQARGTDDICALSPGALYPALTLLARRELIRVRQRERSGARPQRTVYQITRAGRLKLRKDVALTLESAEYHDAAFRAALAVCHCLNTTELVRVLKRRRSNLAERSTVQAKATDISERMSKQGLGSEWHSSARLSGRYLMSHLRAELEWLDETLRHVAGARSTG